MSAMSTQRRKLFIDRKPKSDRHIKGDYMKWLKGAQAQMAALFSVDEYIKHRSQAKKLLVAIRRDRHEAEDRARNPYKYEF